MLIGITGLFGSGKDTAAEYLEKRGYKHCSLSDEIRLELKKRNLPASRENLQQTANQLREKFGSAELASRALKRCRTQKCVLTSIRNPGEVRFLRQNPNFQLWEIWAPIKIRYQRIIKRGRESEKNTTSFQKFQEQEGKELSGAGAKQNLLGVIALADKRIKNDQDIKTLERRLDEVLPEID